MRVYGLAIALAGGCSQYAKTSMTNAPGNTDLATPIKNENGDPLRYQESTDPGIKTLTIFVMPNLMIGSGRLASRGKAVFEPGLELRFEHHEDQAYETLARRTFAITAGIGIVQAYDYQTTGGALYAELDYRFFAGNKVPLDVGLGPAFYPADADLGGQVTVRVFPLMSFRARYTARGGLEGWVGFQLPVPLFFTRSR